MLGVVTFASNYISDSYKVFYQNRSPCISVLKCILFQGHLQQNKIWLIEGEKARSVNPPFFSAETNQTFCDTTQTQDPERQEGRVKRKV